MLQRPVDQLRADVAMLQTQRSRAGQFDRAADPPALAGNGVERTLAVGAVGQNAAALIETCLLRRRFGRGQQQQLELRNAGFVAPGLPRQIGQLFTMVKGENAQLRPRLAAAGDAMEMVEALVDVRARHRFGALQVVVEFDFGRHRRRAAVAGDHQRSAGVGVTASLLPAFVVEPAAQQTRHKGIPGAQHVENLHAHALL